MKKSLEPIDHVPVYRPIDLGARRREPPAIVSADGPYISVSEQERLWKITRQTALGTNAPSVSIEPSEYLAPSDDAA